MGCRPAPHAGRARRRYPPIDQGPGQANRDLAAPASTPPLTADEAAAVRRLRALLGSPDDDPAAVVEGEDARSPPPSPGL